MSKSCQKKNHTKTKLLLDSLWTEVLLVVDCEYFSSLFGAANYEKPFSSHTEMPHPDI